MRGSALLCMALRLNIVRLVPSMMRNERTLNVMPYNFILDCLRGAEHQVLPISESYISKARFACMSGERREIRCEQ